MVIDDCTHSFEELARRVLPIHLERLQINIATPLSMADFAERGAGTKTLLKRCRLAEDFSGCYVFLEREKPVYVGISRTVFQRLSQHVKGTSHFDATLAYRIAESGMHTRESRTKRMANPEFRSLFNGKKEYLRTLKVAYVEIQNPLELYVFEPYCAMELDTNLWNTFRTH